MASALSMMKGKRVHAVGTVLAKGAIGFGTAHLLARHCHGKKDAGKIPVLVAAAGKGLAAIGALFMPDAHGAAGLALGALDAAGQGGLDFLGVVSGLRAARRVKGVRPILVPMTADMKTLPAGYTEADLVGEGLSFGNEVALGALGNAQPGHTMSLDRLREIQSYR